MLEKGPAPEIKKSAVRMLMPRRARAGLTGVVAQPNSMPFMAPRMGAMSAPKGWVFQ